MRWTARADLYALGCVLYELLAGRPPFLGTHAREVLRSHLYDEPRPPSKLAGPLPEGLDELVLRLLAKSPRQRLGHAEDVGRALEALGAGAEPWPGAPRAQPYLYRPGYLALAGDRSGRALLERAQALAEARGAGPDSELGKAVSKLRRACAAFEAGEHHRLFRGDLIEDIPEGLRRWLRGAPTKWVRSTGQLPSIDPDA
jgi:hypothetical protein